MSISFLSFQCFPILPWVKDSGGRECPTVLYCSPLHSVVLHCTELYCTVLRSTGHLTLNYVYPVYCMMYTVKYNLYTGNSTLCNAHWTQYPVHYSLFTVHCTVYNVRCTVHSTIVLHSTSVLNNVPRGQDPLSLRNSGVFAEFVMLGCNYLCYSGGFYVIYV